MSEPTLPSNPEMAGRTLPDQVATFRHLDPAAALAFRTPLQEHAPAADTKAAAILTALGIMVTVLARYGPNLMKLIVSRGFEKYVVVALLVGFAGPGLAAIVQAFRTISPRFPASPPSLAFFGDIARLSREEYIARVESISHDDALEQILIYNHTLATICVDKFQHLGRGVRLFRWAFGSWLVLLVLINVRSFF